METPTEGRQVSINYDDGHLQIREGTHVRTGNQAILYDNESLVKAAHTVSAPHGLDPKTVRTFIKDNADSSFVSLVTSEMLKDPAYREETLRSAANLLGQYMAWKGRETTRGDLKGAGNLKITPGGVGTQTILKGLLGIDVDLAAQYGISRAKIEDIVADLNYAFVRKAWDEAYQKATLYGRLQNPDMNVLTKEFHQNLVDLYNRYESWAAGRREDQYGADHLIGDIKDVLPYVKEETKKFLDGYLKALGDVNEQAKKGTKEVLDDVFDNFMNP